MAVTINGTTGIVTPAIDNNGNLDVDGGTIKLDGNYPVGTNNVALGDDALSSNTSGGANTAIGASALEDNTTASNNTAMGNEALRENTTGNEHTAVGYLALTANTTGDDNTAFGAYALDANTTGSDNVALGKGALSENTTASNNVAVGGNALLANTTGTQNTAVGNVAGDAITTGSYNTVVGHNAGGAMSTGTFNTFVGRSSGSAITTGGKNTIVGTYNGNQGGLDIRTSSNNIVLSDGDGNPRAYFSSASNVWFLPTSYTETTGNAVNVNIGSSGNLRRSTSSLRYKNTVQDMSYGLSDVMNLRPVTYKGNNDGDTVFGGLIAEEVHDAGLTEFVQYDDEGRPDALAYSNMVALAFKAIQELKAENDSLKARVNALENA